MPITLEALEQACRYGADEAKEDARDTKLHEGTRRNMVQTSMTLCYLAFGIAKVRDLMPGVRRGDN